MEYGGDMNRDDIPKSRMAAAAAGSPLFFGNKCKRGHDGLRYTRSGGCVECVNEANEKTRLKIKNLLENAAE